MSSISSTNTSAPLIGSITPSLVPFTAPTFAPSPTLSSSTASPPGTSLTESAPIPVESEPAVPLPTTTEGLSNAPSPSPLPNSPTPPSSPGVQSNNNVPVNTGTAPVDTGSVQTSTVVYSSTITVLGDGATLTQLVVLSIETAAPTAGASILGQESKTNVAAITGGVIGGIAGLTALILLAFFLHRRSRRRRLSKELDGNFGPGHPKRRSRVPPAEGGTLPAVYTDETEQRPRPNPFRDYLTPSPTSSPSPFMTMTPHSSPSTRSGVSQSHSGRMVRYSDDGHLSTFSGYAPTFGSLATEESASVKRPLAVRNI